MRCWKEKVWSVCQARWATNPTRRLAVLQEPPRYRVVVLDSTLELLLATEQMPLIGIYDRSCPKEWLEADL